MIKSIFSKKIITNSLNWQETFAKEDIAKVKLTKLQKKIIYEMVKIRKEYKNDGLSLRLTTLVKRFGYTNSILAKLISKKIKKSAEDLSDKKIIKILFKTPDFYNPGETYEGEAYSLIAEVDKIQLVEPSYFLNNILGIILNIFITFVVIFIIYLLCLLFNNRFENIITNIKNLFQNNSFNIILENISNILFILGVPFSVVTFITKNRKK